MNPRIAMTVEQLWQPVPGGSGRYIVELTHALRGKDISVAGISARHRAREGTPRSLNLTIPVAQAPVPRRLLYPLWQYTSLLPAERVLPGADVVHATTWAIPPTHLPLVVTVHDVAFLRDGQHFTRHGAKYFRAALRHTQSKADLVIVPSEATGADCVRAGIQSAKIRVIPHGVRGFSAEGISGQFTQAHGISHPYILWVGTHEPRKNVRALLEAFRYLVHTDLDLVLVGPHGWGDHSSEKQLIANLPPDRVHVLGRLEDQDLASAYRDARVFCFPSLWEGFGLPVLEAMSAGVPVVTTAGTSMAEVTGDAGILVDVHDASQIAEGILAAAGSEHDRLCEAGRQRAAEFTWEKSAQAHQRVYRELL